MSLTGRVGGRLEFGLNSRRQAGGGGTGKSREGPLEVGQLLLPRFGRVVDDGQKSLRTHCSQRGRRAMQIRLPCRINRRDSPVHSSFGTIDVTCRSIFSGSRVETSFSRLVSLMTCVSTANPGSLNPTPRITR